MSWPANDPGRHVFLIEMDRAPDALVRALGPFALHEATVTSLALAHSPTSMELRVEATGLCQDLAARLGRKLQGMPIVRTVGVGWRA